MVLGLLLGLVSVLIWLKMWLHPARPWDFQPVGDDAPLPPAIRFFCLSAHWGWTLLLTGLL